MDTGDDPRTGVLDVTDRSKVRTSCPSRGGEQRRGWREGKEDGEINSQTHQPTQSIRLQIRVDLG